MLSSRGRGAFRSSERRSGPAVLRSGALPCSAYCLAVRERDARWVPLVDWEAAPSDLLLARRSIVFVDDMNERLIEGILKARRALDYGGLKMMRELAAAKPAKRWQNHSRLTPFWGRVMPPCTHPSWGGKALAPWPAHPLGSLCRRL